jgi:NADPH-dependent 2,4-dienoyl-CoA reductase/sulfur reductase-like enzyme
MNPTCGREKEFSIRPAGAPRKILVVGGGPAGMEAAFVASARGHTVTLWEKAGALGGQSNLAAAPPHKADIKKVSEYYDTQLKKLNVRVELGKNATAHQILDKKPDAVILATGASPKIPDIPGLDQDNVVTAHDILAGVVEAGDRVLVAGGGLVGIETAEFLATKGKKVTVIEMLERVGTDIGVTTRWIIMGRVKKLGIEILTRTKLVRITDKLAAVVKDGEEHTLEADTIVLALGSEPRIKLLEGLQGKVECHAVGDCVEPRNMMDSIYEGAAIAHKI